MPFLEHIANQCVRNFLLFPCQEIHNYISRNTAVHYSLLTTRRSILAEWLNLGPSPICMNILTVLLPRVILEKLCHLPSQPAAKGMSSFNTNFCCSKFFYAMSEKALTVLTPCSSLPRGVLGCNQMHCLGWPWSTFHHTGSRTS